MLELISNNIWITSPTDAGMQDIWQPLLLLALLILTSRTLKSGDADLNHITPTPLGWLKSNRSVLVFWATSFCIYLLCKYIFLANALVILFVLQLTGIWIVIGIASYLIKERFWAESFALAAYTITGLLSFAAMEGSLSHAEELSFQIGTIEVSAWGILTGIVTFVMTLWISIVLSRIVETRIQKVPRLSGSLKVLIAKIIRIAAITVAAMISISSMGVDLSALTVLGGAVGLGLGFGLQKVVSNFVSGIILLTDNSIKPGDVIEIDGTYGWINNLRARYASVITRDGTEHLIPNEDLITQKVINWSFTNNLVRLKIPVGVSYNADPHQCIALLKEAAQTVDRVLSEPKPICLLKGFGDSSVDLELRVWISDPSNGVANVKSQVLLKVWDSLKANDIEIPFPQRDLHIRSSDLDTPPAPTTEIS